MSDGQVADAIVSVNNDLVGVVPDSVSFTEGKGEQKVLPVSEGGGRVSQVPSNDLTTNFATIKMGLRVTPKNVEKALSWKNNFGNNVIEIVGKDAFSNDFVRTFTQCTVTNDYEVPIESEGVIELEFMGNAPI